MLPVRELLKLTPFWTRIWYCDVPLKLYWLVPKRLPEQVPNFIELYLPRTK